MSMLILIYILVCHKTGLGVEWYDWVLFTITFIASVVEGLIKREVQKRLLKPSEAEGADSYFKDLFNSKEKK